MRKYIVLILILFSFHSLAQTLRNDWIIGPSYYHLQYDGFEPKNAFGVNAEYRFAKHFGFELSIAGGKDYLHYGVGSILLPPLVLLLKPNKEGPGFVFLLVGIASCLEQTNFHLVLGKNIEIVPYISILKLRYMYDTNSSIQDTFFGSWSAGTKLSILTNNQWAINFLYEIGNLYESGDVAGQLDRSPGIYGQHVGVNVAYILKSH